jgi:hypothetical protein
MMVTMPNNNNDMPYLVAVNILDPPLASSATIGGVSVAVGTMGRVGVTVGSSVVAFVGGASVVSTEVNVPTTSVPSSSDMGIPPGISTLRLGNSVPLNTADWTHSSKSSFDVSPSLSSSSQHVCKASNAPLASGRVGVIVDIS